MPGLTTPYPLPQTLSFGLVLLSPPAQNSTHLWVPPETYVVYLNSDQLTRSRGSAANRSRRADIVLVVQQEAGGIKRKDAKNRKGEAEP